MSIHQEDFQAALLADSGISAIVGTSVAADQIDGDITPPYIVWSNPSGTGETAHDGTRDDEFPDYRVACWAAGKSSALALAAAVVAALDGKTVAGGSNLSLAYTGQLGQYDPETKLFGEIIEFQGQANSNT